MTSTRYLLGVPTTSRLVSKLHSMRAQNEDDGNPDDKWDWMTGVPTSIRFVAKSWKNIDRGPGGLITDSIEKIATTKDPDFSATVNMLTVLSKVRTVRFPSFAKGIYSFILPQADIKLKAQMKEDDDNSSGGFTAAANRRRSSGRRPSPSGPAAGSGSKSKSTTSGSGPQRSISRASSARTDSDQTVRKNKSNMGFRN